VPFDRLRALSKRSASKWLVEGKERAEPKGEVLVAVLETVAARKGASNASPQNPLGLL
jgi:hypothetical protein